MSRPVQGCPIAARSRGAGAAGVVVCLALGLAAVGAAATTAVSHEGFGAGTAGGGRGRPVAVSTLADDGPGSLREAVAASARTVVFTVSGAIVLRRPIVVRGAFITIDGFTAPPPGITLHGYGLVLRGTRGAHDVIVRGVRIRDARDDGIQIAYGAYNVVVDHVSVHNSGDGNLDITESARDVTVSWTILAAPAGLERKNMLIKYNPSRVTMHHNLLVGAWQRNPQVRIDDAGTPAATTTLDMRNNVVLDWHDGYGTKIWYGARANIVQNVFGNAGGSLAARHRAVIVCNGDCDGNPASQARAFVAGNVSLDAVDVDAAGNTDRPFPAPAVGTEPVCSAARRVFAEAGARPLDEVDRAYVLRAPGPCAQ